MIPDRVRASLDRRRSGAAGPHKSKRRDDEWDWLAEWLLEVESEAECLEPGELKFEQITSAKHPAAKTGTP